MYDGELHTEECDARSGVEPDPDINPWPLDPDDDDDPAPLPPEPPIIDESDSSVDIGSLSGTAGAARLER
jgi:hypothetical protein